MRRIAAIFFAIATQTVIQPALAETKRFESDKVGLQVEILADHLDHPWSVEVLPDDAIVITERAGKIRILRDGRLGKAIAGVPKVSHGGQGGLFDLAVSPDFARNRTLFFTASQQYGGGIGIVLISARLSDDEQSLTDVKTVFRSSNPGVRPANLGSRIAFAPDGTLFVTVGDQFDPDTAQDFNDDHGSVIHLMPDGGFPAGNPFARSGKGRPELWSKGHRNPQGITFDQKTGILYTVEHGAKGGDEINRPEPGKNYGWPVISYGVNYNGSKIGEGTTKPGYEQPLHYWDPSIAPGAIAVYRGPMFPEWDGNFLVTALKFQLISRLERDGSDKITGEEQLLKEKFGRLRDIKVAPDGALLVTTDSDDGRLLRISRAPE